MDGRMDGVTHERLSEPCFVESDTAVPRPEIFILFFLLEGRARDRILEVDGNSR